MSTMPSQLFEFELTQSILLCLLSISQLDQSHLMFYLINFPLLLINALSYSFLLSLHLLICIVEFSFKLILIHFLSSCRIGNEVTIFICMLLSQFSFSYHLFHGSHSLSIVNCKVMPHKLISFGFSHFLLSLLELILQLVVFIFH